MDMKLKITQFCIEKNTPPKLLFQKIKLSMNDLIQIKNKLKTNL